jgi:hypothetical protein
VDNPDSKAIIPERDRVPGVELHVPGADVDVDR